MSWKKMISCFFIELKAPAIVVINKIDGVNDEKKRKHQLFQR